MDAAWNQGESTVGSVADSLIDDGVVRSYTTVLTVMVRLAGKGMLHRARVGRHDVYGPAIGRDDYVQARFAADLDAVITAYGDFAFAQFARRFAELPEARQAVLRQRAEGA